MLNTYRSKMWFYVTGQLFFFYFDMFLQQLHLDPTEASRGSLEGFYEVARWKCIFCYSIPGNWSCFYCIGECVRTQARGSWLHNWCNNNPSTCTNFLEQNLVEVGCIADRMPYKQYNQVQADGINSTWNFVHMTNTSNQLHQNIARNFYTDPVYNLY